MKTQHQIIIDASRSKVWDAFAGGDATLIDNITEQRKPVFLAGTVDAKGFCAIIVSHFEDAGPDQTRVTVYANRFFSGLKKLTSVLNGRALKRDIDDRLERLKLLIESERQSQ